MFDPDRFLQEHRHLPLVLLRQHLNQRLQGYKTALMELINADYAVFIRLGADLRQVEVALMGSSLQFTGKMVKEEGHREGIVHGVKATSSLEHS